MATALCDLQSELKCSPRVQDLQSRTPPIREHKRKRSKKPSVRVKVETRFAEDYLEDPRLLSGTCKVLTHSETNDNLPSLPSVAIMLHSSSWHTGSTYGASTTSNLGKSVIWNPPTTGYSLQGT
ncbi:hypothetical protein ACP70R_001814 [Stipagrostis hirtigluma subsp. patula]